VGILEGKVAIVTGGAGGIGSGTCRLLAREGAAVVVADLPRAKPSDLADELRQAGHRSVGVEVDITDEGQVQNMIDVAMSEFGRLDGLHANAAATHLVRTDTLLTELTRAEFEEAFQVNVIGTWLCCKTAIPAMLAGGGGSMVATSSMAARTADFTKSAYTATKASIGPLMRVFATQFGTQGIRFNTVLPGFIENRDREGVQDGFKKIIKDNILTPEFGDAESIGSLVAYLFSDASKYLQAQEFAVDGGMHSHVMQYAYVKDKKDAMFAS
jgi:NAD(P)-dependent dehydrogenase (short-subunit alcohol dehydrogenase family)